MVFLIVAVVVDFKVETLEELLKVVVEIKAVVITAVDTIIKVVDPFNISKMVYILVTPLSSLPYSHTAKTRR